MIVQEEIQLPAFSRGFHLITKHVEQAFDGLPDAGLLHVFVKHTSAGITVNENADPSVRIDFENVFNKLIPDGDTVYTHTLEGDDDMPAHIKTSLVGSSVTIPVKDGKLNLGIWQGIYLCEFRNHAGPRKLVLTIYM
jgi:secondary thiamine-phosphate synthase enzyme